MDNNSSFIALEVIRGQLDNVHHVMEQLLLSRTGLLDHVTFASTVLKLPLPVKERSKKVKEKVRKDSPKQHPWRLNETRTVLIPMSVTCVDISKRIFVVEELTQLGSIVLSLKNSCDVLMNTRETIAAEEG